MIAGPSAPPPPLSLRFRGRAADVLYTFPAGMALAAATALTYKHFTGDVNFAYLFAAWAVGWALVLFPVAWFRWRRRLRIDDAGVTFMRPRGRVLAELRWEEVEAFALFGYQGVEIRGAGRTIQIGDAFERVGEVWAWLRARCEERILDGLRERLKRGESTELRSATSRTWAHALYLLLTVGLACMTVFYAWTFWQSRIVSRWGAIVPLVMWTVLMLLTRRDVSGKGGWVRVSPEGLTVKRLDARWEVSWKEALRLSFVPRKGWCLERGSGRPLPIPATLLNLSALCRLVSERAGSA